jgi:hypothetical protein
VLKSTTGNVHHAAPVSAAGGAENAAVFAKPTPVAGVAAKPSGAVAREAGKENSTATASTSGESEQAEKRWQVRCGPDAPFTRPQAPYTGARGGHHHHQI